jgi:hypothetical protein
MATQRAGRSLGPIILIAAGVVLMIGVAIWAFVPGLFSSQSAEPTAATSNIPYPNVPRISLADAYAAWVAGNAVFVDVRGDTFYDATHIPGALSIPENLLNERQEQLNKSDWIITYCT